MIFILQLYKCGYINIYKVKMKSDAMILILFYSYINVYIIYIHIYKV